MWIKKREYVTYMLLYKFYREEPFNIGDAVSILSCFMSRTTAFNSFKKLYKLGWVKRLNNLTYRLLGLEELFHLVALPYIEGRLKRALRSRGIRVYGSRIEDGKIIVEVDKIPRYCEGMKSSGFIDFLPKDSS